MTKRAHTTLIKKELQDFANEFRLGVPWVFARRQKRTSEETGMVFQHISLWKTAIITSKHGTQSLFPLQCYSGKTLRKINSI